MQNVCQCHCSISDNWSRHCVASRLVDVVLKEMLVSYFTVLSGKPGQLGQIRSPLKWIHGPKRSPKILVEHASGGAGPDRDIRFCFLRALPIANNTKQRFHVLNILEFLFMRWMCILHPLEPIAPLYRCIILAYSTNGMANLRSSAPTSSSTSFPSMLFVCLGSDRGKSTIAWPH